MLVTYHGFLPCNINTQCKNTDSITELSPNLSLKSLKWLNHIIREEELSMYNPKHNHWQHLHWFNHRGWSTVASISPEHGWAAAWFFRSLEQDSACVSATPHSSVCSFRCRYSPGTEPRLCHVLCKATHGISQRSISVHTEGEGIKPLTLWCHLEMGKADTKSRPAFDTLFLQLTVKVQF